MGLLPKYNRLLGRWRLERAVSVLGPALWVLSGWFLVLLMVAWGLPLTSTGFGLVLIGAVLGVLGAIGFVLAWSVWAKPGSRLAKRVDHVFQMADEALSFDELVQTEKYLSWQPLIRRGVESRLRSIEQEWKIEVPASTKGAGGLAAVAAMLLAVFLAFDLVREIERVAEVEAAATQRLAAAEEVLDDWEQFVKETDDEDLREVFHEAGQLREALASRDPLEAMQAINDIEDRIAGLETRLARESIADQASSLAEALEAFDGMAAMSAALRSQNFAKAAMEAKELSNRMDPDAQTPVRREDAVSEMLANEASKAGEKGREKFRQTLNRMSQAANSGLASNKGLRSDLQKLSEEFAKESQCQGRGRMLALGQQQLEALRQRLRDGEQGLENMPSLCQAAGLGDRPGGKEAGVGSSDPLGDRTELLDAGSTETVSGMPGEGDSEFVTMASAQGSGTAVASASAAEIANAIDLSRQAVLDESLPLAHRRILRDYFEKIRPDTNSQ